MPRAGGRWRRRAPPPGAVTDLGAGPFDRSNTAGINARGWAIGWQFSAAQDERAAC